MLVTGWPSKRDGFDFLAGLNIHHGHADIARSVREAGHLLSCCAPGGLDVVSLWFEEKDENYGYSWGFGALKLANFS